MTDYALRAADEATMFAAFETVGILRDGVLKEQDTLPDGTQWVVLYIGMAVVDGVLACYAILRWNGGAPTPPLPPGIEIFWSSATEDPYPEGLTRFA